MVTSGSKTSADSASICDVEYRQLVLDGVVDGLLCGGLVVVLALFLFWASLQVV